MSANGSVLIVVDIAPADHSRLRENGFGRVDDRSWFKEKRKDQGFEQLLRDCGLEIQTPAALHQVTVSVDSDTTTISDYFSQFVLRLHARISGLLQPDTPVTVILNLMPFCLSISRIDKMVIGLFGSDSFFHQMRGSLVVMVRNVDWILKSEKLAMLRSGNALQTDLLALDIRGYVTRFAQDKAPSNHSIGRGSFRQILDLDTNEIYRSLVFGTNAYIGHYELRNSHVRTHYDLEEFVKRDNVWEYLYGAFLEVVGETDRLLMIGTGMEVRVLQRITEQLKSALEDRHTVDIECIPSHSLAREISVGWSERYDMAVVITDIVNSGETLKGLVSTLADANSGEKPIRAFAITQMKNSPSVVSGVSLAAGVKIRRDYYPNDPSKCPLCQIHQPLTTVHTADDFCRVEKGQLTPFDFWEIINDSGSLIKNRQDLQGRRFSYRVDTARVVRRYANWLGNTVAHFAAEAWPNCRPDVICTVDEESGVAFADLVAGALGVSRVVSVPRQVLRKVTPSGGLPPDVDSPLCHSDQVLVVDDGANFGGTLMSLIAYCRAATRMPPMGALVLDSRLDTQGVGKISAQMARRPLIALYQWPAPNSKLLD